MKTKLPGQIKLIEGGKNNWEKTSKFKNKVDEIKKDLTDKYSLILSKERNWFKRLLIKVRFMIEMRKKIEELSSLKNLHTINQTQSGIWRRRPL